MAEANLKITIKNRQKPFGWLSVSCSSLTKENSETTA